MDPSTCLLRLVESKHRQEQLMEKLCALLVSVEAKVGRVAAAQEKLEAAVQSRGGGGQAAGPVGDVSNIMGMMNSTSFSQAEAQQSAQAAAFSNRGRMIKPLGQKEGGGAPPPASQQPTMPVAQFLDEPADRSIQYDQQRQAEADRIAAEQLRARQREEEIRRRQEEEELRQRQEAERRRLEQERIAEEERKRKAALSSRTQGMMSGLLDGGPSDLFQDEPAPKPKKAGGLFDDDD